MFLKLKLITVLIFSYSTVAFSRAPGTHYQLKSTLNKISQRNLITWVNEFVHVSMPSRMVGMPGHEKAREYITDTIIKSDPKKSGKLAVSSFKADLKSIKKFYQSSSYMQNFAEKRKEFPVQNITWEKSGINSGKVLVVTAHYDTISFDKNTLRVKEKESMPGANYNASGVAIALGLIKTLASIDLNYSVQVVFLDWHGIGLHGSEIHAKELKASGKEVLGVINLEMLGQDTTYFDKGKKKGNMVVYIRDQAEEKTWIKKLTDHGSKMSEIVSFEIKPQGFELSDNIRFWEQGFLSATFSQNWEEDFNPKFFQTPQDTPETLNHKTLWHAYRYVGGAVIGTLLDLTK